MLKSTCCNADIIGKGGEDEYLNFCSLCEHSVEGLNMTYDDESPEECAKQFNLEYLKTEKHPFNGEDIHWFNDLETGSTLLSDNLSDLEDKVMKSRETFK